MTSALLERSITSPFSREDGIYDHQSADIPEGIDQLQANEVLYPYLDYQTIQAAITWAAREIIQPLVDQQALFLYNLKGAETFAVELQELVPGMEIMPIKVSTASGYKQFSEVKEDKTRWPDLDVFKGRTKIVVVEDINDSGQTLNYIAKRLIDQGIAADDIITITLFSKLIDQVAQHTPTYVLLEVINEFLVGQGLDEGNDRFRDLMALYILTNEKNTDTN